MPSKWPEITEFYRNVRGFAELDPAYRRGASAIGDVADYIASTWLHEGLFGYTSHYALCLHQVDQSPLEASPILRIEPLRVSDQVEFRFLDTRNAAKQWSRTVPPEDTLPRFIKTLSQLHWISIAALANLPTFGLQTR